MGQLQVVDYANDITHIFPIDVSAATFTETINWEIDRYKETALNDEINQISPVVFGVAFIPSIVLFIIGSGILWAFKGFKK